MTARDPPLVSAAAHDRPRVLAPDGRRVLAIVQEVAREVHGDALRTAGLELSHSLERDFGFDSLTRLELAHRLEREFGRVIADDALALAETPAELLRALSSGLAAAPTAAVRPDDVPATQVAPAFVTLPEALCSRARETPDRPYLQLYVDAEHVVPLAFAELDRAARRVAAYLLDLRVARGDNIGIMLPTSREFFVAFFGVWYAGCVPVPLYPPTRASQLEAYIRRTARILSNCRAPLLIAPREARRLDHLLVGHGSVVRRLVTVAELESREFTAAPASLRDVDTALLQYTSGSTGQPKGVVLSHANILANLAAMQEATQAQAGDRFVSWLPLYHDMGLIGAALGALVVGFPLVLMSPLQFLARPVRWLRALHRHRATLTAAPNFAYELCLKKIDDTELAGLDLSSVRLMFNGAEAVSAATLEQFGARFAPYGLRSSALTPVYGLAESALGVAFPPLGRGPRIESVQRAEFLTTGNAVRAGNDATSPLRFVSCGQPLPRHDLRILDDQGIALPERHQGHIQFRGPSATAGYFESPHESAALIDGAWRNTGDLGFIAAGELFVTGRSKDIIVRGGHNIHPQELEEAVGQLDGVRKGCVVAFAAAAAGTEKLVVLAETRAADPESRRALTRKINHLTVDLLGLPADEIVLAPPHTVLKTSSGKLRRAACREAFERGDLLALHRAEQSPARLALAWLRGWSRDVLRQTRETSWSVRLVLVALATAPIAVVALALARSEHARRRHIARIARTALRAAGLAPQINGDLSQLARGTTVAVVNHSSYLDSIVLTASLPPEMVFVAKNELRTARFLGPLLRRLGTVFVERFDVGAALAGAESLQRKLQQGRSLIVFPEGTFRRESGLLPFHLGAFAAAAAAGAIVVPIALAGTRRVLPDGARWPRRGAIAVNVTRPIQPTGADWRSAIALRDVARGAISAELAEGDR